MSVSHFIFDCNNILQPQAAVITHPGCQTKAACCSFGDSLRNFLFRKLASSSSNHGSPSNHESPGGLTNLAVGGATCPSGALTLDRALNLHVQDVNKSAGYVLPTELNGTKSGVDRILLENSISAK